jgi:putative methionine-R-sulfoxide reductase with GAF domain
MAAIVQPSPLALPNRRRRVRHKVHVPAYASFSVTSQGVMLDLHEILNLSEVGVAVQCSAPMEINSPVELCLDLAESSGQIFVTAQVVWSDPDGRVGFSLPNLTDSMQRRLREWLFLNAMAASANAAANTQSDKSEKPLLRQNYTDVLTAASAVQREADSLGSDLEAVISLIAARSLSLLRASGAAIALAGKDSGTMICRASAGPSAPPVGASLQVGSGFSGECVRTGRTLRCDDTETDDRVDRESCRALGLRSILAVPVRMGEKVIGLLEVFSAHPGAFTESDSTVLQRFVETIVAAVARAARAYDSSVPPPPAPKPFVPAPGSVLFAHPPEEKENDKNEKLDASAAGDKVGGIRLPRTHLYLLVCSAITIFFALGFILAPLIQPWIQEKLQARQRSGEQTVLASSHPPADASKSTPTADSANLDQLRDLAGHGDPAAENALGLLYAQGDEKQSIRQDESEASRWFTKAAEAGNIPAQSKLGSLYWGGRGVPQDSNRAYFWTVLARANGDEASKALAPFIATRLTPSQRTAIEQQAEQWLERHESPAKKPSPARSLSSKPTPSQ